MDLWTYLDFEGSFEATRKKTSEGRNKGTKTSQCQPVEDHWVHPYFWVVIEQMYANLKEATYVHLY